MNVAELSAAEIEAVSGGDAVEAAVWAAIMHAAAYMMSEIWNAQPDGTQISDIMAA
jgi:hypothetical protein